MEHKIKAWGVKRKEVDIEKLALAYYLVARFIVEERRAKSSKEAPEVVRPEDQKAA